MNKEQYYILFKDEADAICFAHYIDKSSNAQSVTIEEDWILNEFTVIWEEKDYGTQKEK